MRRSLTFKLTLSFLAVSLLGVALVAGYTVLVGANEFQRLAYQRALGDFSLQVQTYYQNNGTLQGIKAFVGPPDQPRPLNNGGQGQGQSNPPPRQNQGAPANGNQ